MTLALEQYEPHLILLGMQRERVYERIPRGHCSPLRERSFVITP
jgi:hypothetical protein